MPHDGQRQGTESPAPNSPARNTDAQNTDEHNTDSSADLAALRAELTEARDAISGLRENNKTLIKEKAKLQKKYKALKSDSPLDALKARVSEENVQALAAAIEGGDIGGFTQSLMDGLQAETVAPLREQRDALELRAELAERELSNLRVTLPIGDLFIQMGGQMDAKDLVVPLLAREFRHEEGKLVAYHEDGTKRSHAGGRDYTPKDAIDALRAQRPSLFRGSQLGDLGGSGAVSMRPTEMNSAVMAAQGDRAGNVAYARAQMKRQAKTTQKQQDMHKV